MKCKNCDNQADDLLPYCPYCGGKLKVSRITFKTIFNEILDKFFNVDSKFLQTFIVLAKNPQEVVVGFINGARNKFFHPISFFALALTLSGFYLYLLKSGAVNFEIMTQQPFGNQSPEQLEISNKINKFVLEYTNLMTFLFIPFYVFFVRLLFKKYHKYNWAEFFVIVLYLYTFTSIVSTVVILISLLNEYLFLLTSFFTVGFQFFYFAYALKKIFNLTVEKIILRCLLFGVIFFLIMLFLIISGIAIGFYMKKNNLI